MNGTDDGIILDDETPPAANEKPPEQAPAWASSMADTMKALADRVTTPTPAAQPGMSKAQIDEINERITKGIVDGNPLGTLAPMAGQVANEIVDGRLKHVNNEVIESFLDRFKSRQKEDYDEKGQLTLYRQISKQFEKELEGENLTGLISQDRAARDRHLNRVWKAATGEVLEKRVATKTPSRPAGASAGDGAGMGESRGTRGAYKMPERERAIIMRSMPKEAAEKSIADIEAAMVGVSDE